MDAQAKTNTLSIWTDLNFKEYENPFYENKISNKFIREIIPNYSFHKLRVWEEYFFRWYKNGDNQIKLNSNILQTHNFSKKILF